MRQHRQGFTTAKTGEAEVTVSEDCEAAGMGRHGPSPQAEPDSRFEGRVVRSASELLNLECLWSPHIAGQQAGGDCGDGSVEPLGELPIWEAFQGRWLITASKNDG